MLGAVLDLLFPRRCLGCRGPVWPFCAGCLAAVAVLTPPGCRRCGRPADPGPGGPARGGSADGCRDCPPPEISWSRSAFLYDGPIRSALLGVKFSGRRSDLGVLVPAMVQALERGPPSRPDAVTWVPLGARRRRQRGFDQGEVLARALARQAALPCARLLVRTRETPPQAKRAGTARREALTGAFRAVGAAPPSVVLVDDVLTSGATAAACARALRDAGARRVGVLTAARSLGAGVPSRCYGWTDLGLASRDGNPKGGMPMELTLNGRGLRITDQHRRAIEHRVAKLDRRPRPAILRVEVEIIHEPTPRIAGGHRVQMSCETPRRTFRAEGAGETVDAALDRAFERVERQISTYRSKRSSASRGARAAPVAEGGEPPIR